MCILIREKRRVAPVGRHYKQNVSLIKVRMLSQIHKPFSAEINIFSKRKEAKGSSSGLAFTVANSYKNSVNLITARIIYNRSTIFCIWIENPSYSYRSYAESVQTLGKETLWVHKITFSMSSGFMMRILQMKTRPTISNVASYDTWTWMWPMRIAVIRGHGCGLCASPIWYLVHEPPNPNSDQHDRTTNIWNDKYLA